MEESERVGIMARLTRINDVRADGLRVSSTLILASVFAFITLSAVLAAHSSGYDNDLWWLLASGREVCENGIPYTNPWSVHDGQGTVIQQWLSAVILYQLYMAGGMTAVEAFVVVQAVVLIALIFVLCGVASRGRNALDTIFGLLALSVPSLTLYWSCRPHLWTMIAYVLLLIVMESYRASGRARVLIAAPIIALVHVNLHSSMAPVDVVICAVYLVPSVDKWLALPSLHRAGELRAAVREAFRARVPLIVCTVAVAVALLLNPYGLRGALYVLLSYGSADYRGYINEMGCISVWTAEGGCMIALTAIGAYFAGKQGVNRLDLARILLPLVFLPLSMMHTRNVWLFTIFVIPLIASSVGSFSPSRLLPRFLHVLLPGLAAALVCVVALAYNFPGLTSAADIEDHCTDCESTPKMAAQYLEENTDVSSVRLYSTFNSGGYFEWHGMKVGIDARPELWAPAITGFTENWYTDYVDLAKSKSPNYDSYFEGCNFTHVLAANDSKITDYMRGLDGWYQVMSGNGYTLWQRDDYAG